MQIVKLNKNNIPEIAKEINRGRVVICPTDTVYGFLADASNKKAVDKIFKIKNRPRSKPLAVFVKDIKAAKELAEISDSQEKILKEKWLARPKPAGGGGPGKFSFVFKRKKTSNRLYGLDKKTVAIRIPKYKFLNVLLSKIDKPLVQTSVNVSNNPALSKISDIIEQFAKQDVLLIDGGNLKKSKASKVIDFSEEEIKILRN